LDLAACSETGATMSPSFRCGELDRQRFFPTAPEDEVRCAWVIATSSQHATPTRLARGATLECALG